MICVEELCKTFTKKEKKKMTEFYAVDHVSFEIQKGEIVGILGPNGAGKTTLLRMLGQLMQPTFGTVTMKDELGTSITQIQQMKQKIGYLSGNTKLYGRLSSKELLMMYGEIYGLSKEECKKRCESIFEMLSMFEFCDNRIDRLSTGQTQRASIARCLIHNPEVYIFDEPTLGLDIISSDAILSFMKEERKKGKSVLYSTHYMEEAQFLCDRILFLKHGKVIAQGTPKQLMEDTKTQNLRETFHVLWEGEY